MSLSTVYEDDLLLIIDKPQGMPTTPGKQESLCWMFFAERPELAGVRGFRPGEGGLLNRLDNKTGGLVLFAKSDTAFEYYKKEMKERRVRKWYQAVTDGIPPDDQGVVDLAVAHARNSRRKMVPVDGRRAFRGKARQAVSRWTVVQRRPPYALLTVEITRGARHQIRIHLAAAGMPIVGDKLYNKKPSALIADNHLLYCFRIDFQLPDGGSQTAAVPAPFSALLENLPVIRH